MYTLGLELFFDFAGYSMFALAISNLMGIHSPSTLTSPFVKGFKEFLESLAHESVFLVP